MRIKISILLLSLFTLSGCFTPKEDVTVSDLDLVVVDYDGEYDFRPPRTFYMPDSITRAENRLVDEDDNEKRFDAQILKKISDEMIAKGFTRVDDANIENADLVMLVNAVRSDTYIIGSPCFWGCWGWAPWPPGWGWGPGWGWPYPPTVVGSYSKGSVFMNLIDPNRPIQGDNLNQVWLGAVNGLIQGSDESIARRLDTSIEKAFALSPYLNR